MSKPGVLFSGKFLRIYIVLTLLAGFSTLVLAVLSGVEDLNSRKAPETAEPVKLAVLEATLQPAATLSVPSSTPFIPTGTATPKPPATSTPIPTATVTPVTACQRPERVLVIVLDGMRPDAIRDTGRAPFILNLALQQGSYTWNGLTIDPSVTIPAHTSLLTGLDVPVHGVTRNDLHNVEGEYLKSESLFNFAKERDRFTGLVSGKKQLGYFLQPGALNIAKIYKKADNLTVADYVTQVIADNDFDLLVVNFGYTDIVGHIEGWMSEPYLAAVAQADQAVRQVFETLEKLGYLDTSLVVILADHGGKGFGHSKNRPEDETIPWIIRGPCVKPGFELPLKPRLRIFDTAPTLLWALGWDVQADFSGRVIQGAFEEQGFALSADAPALP